MHRLQQNSIWFRYWSRYFRPLVRTGIRLDRLTNGLLDLIIKALYRFTTYGPHEAAALAYYALFSLFPLMLLIIVVSTLFLDSAAASNQIRDFLAFFFPGDTANVLQDAVTAAAEQRGSASIFAIIVLAWSSANLFGNLEKVLSNVFGLPRRRKIYERRLIGAVMITVLGIFLLASLLTNLIFSLLGLVFFNQFSTWLTLASFLVPVAFNAAIFAMLYGFITASHLRWDAILSASLIGGIAFEFAKMGFVWYLSSLTNFTFIYGSVTTVVVFMLWAFLTFCLVLIFAEIARILDEWIGQTSAEALETDAPQIMIEDHEPRHLLPPPE